MQLGIKSIWLLSAKNGQSGKRIMRWFQIDNFRWKVFKKRDYQ